MLRFRVCESEFVDLTPNKPEKVGDVPGAAAAVMPAGSKKVPYTIHVSRLNNRLFRVSLYDAIDLWESFLCEALLQCI